MGNTAQSTKFTQIRKALEVCLNISKEQYKNDSYRLDRGYLLQYFDIHPKWKDKIVKYLREIKSKDEDFCHIDICGRALGNNLGIKKSYSFSINGSRFDFFNDKKEVFIDGDIFNSKDFSFLLKTVTKEGIQPTLITFEPVAGLSAYCVYKNTEENPYYEKVLYQILTKRLIQLILILKPGGYIYLERPFQAIGIAEFFNGIPQNKWKISMHIKKIAKKLKCTFEVKIEIGGPYFLLRKSPQ